MDTKSNLNQQHPPSSGQRKNSVQSAVRPSRSQQIEGLCSDIEKTRREAEKTIRELERRLSFSQLKAQVKNKAQQITMGKATIMENQALESSKHWAAMVIDAVRQNPLPAVMIGGGLAWLAANLAGRESQEDHDPLGGYYERRQKDTVDETGTYGMGFIERRRVPQTVGALKKEAMDRAQKLKDEAAAKFQETGQRSGEMGGRIREEALKAGEQVRHKAEEIGHTAADYGRRAQDRVAQSGRRAKAGFFHFMENHPFTVAGIVLAAGAVAGLVIPESRYEDRKLGPARDQALDRAREKGREEVEKVKAVAREAKEAAKAEADRQDLLQREKAEGVEEKVAQAAEKVKAKIREGAEAVKEKL